jgi:hypothetical protein
MKRRWRVGRRSVQNLAGRHCCPTPLLPRVCAHCRSGRLGGQGLEPLACLCRWQVAHLQQPLCRARIRRRGTPPRPRSRSVRKKSPTSAWGPSTSSTRKTPEHGSAKDLPNGAEAAEAAAEARVAPALKAMTITMSLVLTESSSGALKAATSPVGTPWMWTPAYGRTDMI